LLALDIKLQGGLIHIDGEDLSQVEERPPELVMALLPSLVRTMLAAFVEVMAEQRASKTEA
jgi:hypothetical protein